MCAKQHNRPQSNVYANDPMDKYASNVGSQNATETKTTTTTRKYMPSSGQCWCVVSCHRILRQKLAQPHDDSCFFFLLLCIRLARTLGYGQQTNFLMHFYFEREPTNSVSPSLSLLRLIVLDRLSRIQSVWRNVKRQMCYFSLFIRLVINFRVPQARQDIQYSILV